MDENQVRKIAQDEIQKAAQQAQYSVTRVPVHTHNNIDSPNIPAHSVVGFQGLPGGLTGVGSPLVLNGQNLAFGDAIVNLEAAQYTNVYTYPFPVIYGDGTSTAETLTGTPSSGAVSATLTGNWGGSTGNYAAKFDNNEIRIVRLTNASTAVTWSYPLQTGGVGTGLNIIDNSRFHGGDAVPGTAIIFRNDADGILQLWVRTESQSFAETWAYVDLNLSITD